MTTKKSLFWSFLSEYSVFCVSFIVSLVMARLLTPAEFGIYAIAVTLTELLVLFRQFGIGRYIVQAKELDEARLRSALGVMIVLCWSFALIIYFGAGAASSLYGHPELKLVMQVMAIAFVLVPFSQPGVALLERHLQFRTLMFINIFINLVNGAAAIGFAYFGFKAVSLAIASVSMQVAMLACVLWVRPAGQVFMPGLSKWREVLGFGGYVISSNLIAYIGTSAPTAVLGKLVDIASVGLFSRALSLIVMLRQLLQAAIARAMYAQLAKLENEGASLYWTYSRILGFGTALVWSASAVLYFTATPVITFLYGAQWSSAGPLLSNLCIAMGLQATVPLYLEVMFIKNKQMSLLKRDLLINIFALANFTYWALHSVQAAALSRSVDAAIFVVVYLPLLLKLTQVEGRQAASILLQSLAVAVLSALPAIAVMSYFGWPKTLPAFILIPLGLGSVVTWVLALLVVQHPLAADIKAARRAIMPMRQK
jgi:O-antigen/teichoic acid export membrane protein